MCACTCVRWRQQVWAKKQPHGAVAVLFLNARNDTAQDISIELVALGLSGSAYKVRDVWGKKQVGGVVGKAYTAAGIPPQDSQLVLFSPA